MRRLSPEFVTTQAGKRDQDYREHVARREQIATAWREHALRQDLVRARQQTVEVEDVAAAEIDRLSKHIAGLVTAVKRAEAEHEAMRDEVTDLAKTTADGLATVSRSTVKLAEGIGRETVAKTSTTKKGYRQIPVRDPKTRRIMHVDIVPIPEDA